MNTMDDENNLIDSGLVRTSFNKDCVDHRQPSINGTRFATEGYIKQTLHKMIVRRKCRPWQLAELSDRVRVPDRV